MPKHGFRNGSLMAQAAETQLRSVSLALDSHMEEGEKEEESATSDSTSSCTVYIIHSTGHLRHLQKM